MVDPQQRAAPMSPPDGPDWADQYLRQLDEKHATIHLPTRWGHRGKPRKPLPDPPDFDETFLPPEPYLRGFDGAGRWVAICWDCAHVTRWPMTADADGEPAAMTDPDLDHTCDTEPDIHGLRALAWFDIRAAARVLGYPQAARRQTTDPQAPEGTP